MLVNLRDDKNYRGSFAEKCRVAEEEVLSKGAIDTLAQALGLK